MVAIALAAGLLFQPAGNQSFESLVGAYQLVPAESDNVPKAVDRVVGKMNFLIRGTARSRIMARNIAYPSVLIAKEGAGFRIHLEKGSNVVLAPDGPAVEWKTAEGEAVQIRLEPGFREVIQAKDGVRENVFSLAGDRLMIKAKLTSERLPEPITYRLVYQRKQ